ncbi:hypothetical protein ACIBCP_06980 [Streptomyces sp. NPDC051287]|uniref:hypothetical protein n=1 Tax=Streptomyces sp. NPDC051287 TaxID=3365648 RepID=UPI0037A934AA
MVPSSCHQVKHQYTQEAITSEADIHALDRALAVISVDPEICAPVFAVEALLVITA